MALGVLLLKRYSHPARPPLRETHFGPSLLLPWQFGYFSRCPWIAARSLSPQRRTEVLFLGRLRPVVTIPLNSIFSPFAGPKHNAVTGCRLFNSGRWSFCIPRVQLSARKKAHCFVRSVGCTVDVRSPRIGSLPPDSTRSLPVSDATSFHTPVTSYPQRSA